MPSSKKSHCHPESPVRAVHVQEQSRNWAPHYARQRGRRHEPRDRSRSCCRREPSFQIQNDARKKSCLRRPKQKAQHVETAWRVSQRHARRDHPPRNHQQRNPPLRTKTLKRKITRNLEQEISSEEHARAETVDCVVKMQFLLHLKRSKTHIDTIQIGDDIEEKKKRHQPPGQLANDCCFQLGICQISQD